MPMKATAAHKGMFGIMATISEFRDVVFEDVVFDNDRCNLILYLDFAQYVVTELPLSNTTSSNTTSLNSRPILIFAEYPLAQKSCDNFLALI